MANGFGKVRGVFDVGPAAKAAVRWAGVLRCTLGAVDETVGSDELAVVPRASAATVDFGPAGAAPVDVAVVHDVRVMTSAAAAATKARRRPLSDRKALGTGEP